MNFYIACRWIVRSAVVSAIAVLLGPMVSASYAQVAINFNDQTWLDDLHQDVVGPAGKLAGFFGDNGSVADVKSIRPFERTSTSNVDFGVAKSSSESLPEETYVIRTVATKDILFSDHQYSSQNLMTGFGDAGKD